MQRPAGLALHATVALLVACSADGDPAGATGKGGESGAPDAGATADDLPTVNSCAGVELSPQSDYGARGPFDVTIEPGSGPGGGFTVFRPASLGGDGFRHAPVTWGNGIGTLPEHYEELLSTIASNGFVIVASESTNVTAALMKDGLDWLIAQNDAPGPFQGALAVECAATVGYSLGGGAAIGSGDHPRVQTTISLHGLQGPAENLQGPLLLINSTNDGFVTKEGYTVPTYNRSTVVPTLMATLEVPGAEPDFAGHLIPLVDGGEERAPTVAWLRYFLYGDPAARGFFYGADCVLCQTPWIDIERKNGNWD
jgi:hypothetical protein